MKEGGKGGTHVEKIRNAHKILIGKPDNTDMERFKLPVDRIQWQALVNTVMNFSISTNGREYLDRLGGCQLLKKDSALFK
jgi:hypothetical protein